MCFWLITACLSLLPPAPQQVVNVGIPAPIITPTAATPTPGTSYTVYPSMPSYYPSTPRPYSPMNPPQMSNPSYLPQGSNQSGIGGAPPGQNPPGVGSPPQGLNPPFTGMGMQNSNPPYMNTGSNPPYMNTGYNPPMMNPGTNQIPTNPNMNPSSNLISQSIPSYPTSNQYVLCPNPNVVCTVNPGQVISNPYQTYPNYGVPGRPLAIDPRLGTTPGYQMAGGPPIIAYNGQYQNPAVNFPRNKRSNKINTDKKDLTDIKTKKKRQVNNCVCVAGPCPTGNNFGSGFIDFRIVTPGGGGGQCPQGQNLCCGGAGGTGQVACGTVQQTPPTAVQPTTGQAAFGEFPWQALILTNQNDYVAGGVLIDQMNVLTVVHRLTSYLVAGTAPNLKVRLGEWDAAAVYEPVPYQEYAIRRVFTHEQFNPSTLQYDIAVVRLSTAVPIAPQVGAASTINRACLPQSTGYYTGQRCWVTGWGKNAFGTAGVYQQILKKVDVPIVDSASCQATMRTARLGSTFVLDTTSFICAGGELNKDSCTGDGGSGLVCAVDGRWTVVGLVAWGLGCASGGVPGAYVNVPALLPWINQKLISN